MLFNSFDFLVFFPLVTALYFIATPPSETGLGQRWVVLLAASCAFYMWLIPKYILILAVTIVVDFVAAILIENCTGSKRRNYLIVSLLTTCSILFFFKYFNFFNSNFLFIAKSLGLNYSIGMLNIILPIGLSFHTFQSMSYVIEVYRGNQKAERHFGIFSLYVMFYPQLVAGPIERPQHLLHQFREHYTFSYSRAVEGLRLMAWGLFKKIVIADRLALVVDSAYNFPGDQDGVSFSIAAIFFAFQIYCDFSGYSDIAVGSARVMGFDLTNNFKGPFFSKTTSEFWQRWHISLASWWRDYLYIPMGGNRCSKIRAQFNLFATFFISGLWHGANWTYVAYGGLNGLYIIFSKWTGPLRTQMFEGKFMEISPRIFKLYQVIVTFVLFFLGLILFRSSTLAQALDIILRLHHGWWRFFYLMIQNNWKFTDRNLLRLDESLQSLIGSFLLISFLIWVDVLQRKKGIEIILTGTHWMVRWSFYFFVIFSLIFLGVYGENQFIYFQF